MPNWRPDPARLARVEGKGARGASLRDQVLVMVLVIRPQLARALAVGPPLALGRRIRRLGCSLPPGKTDDDRAHGYGHVLVA